LFRGNAEEAIRKNLIQRGYIRAIIGLPANLFYGTGIPACIVLVDKKDAQARKGIFMIDASKGFEKDGPKNRLREQDIHKIVDVFNRQQEIPRFSRLVPLTEIADPKNNFNLNLPRYIDSSEPEDLQDIDGHLRGGIPDRDIQALANYWKILPKVRGILFENAGREGYAKLKLPIAEVKAAILGHSEFTTFKKAVTELFTQWKQAVEPALRKFGQGGLPKPLIEDISEKLLTTFKAAPLLDAYDIYQHLMSYWTQTMQDDAYLIAAEGWAANPARIIETDKKGKRKDKGWTCDLVPKALIVACYFSKEQTVLEAKQTELEIILGSLAELEEEHGTEDGVLGRLEKIAKTEVNNQLHEIKGEKDSKDEAEVLTRWLELSESETALKREVKALDAALDTLAIEKYPKLREAEIKTLVIDKKWMAFLEAAIQGELDRVSQTLTGRIRQLAERYATPLPRLTDEVAALSARVDGHLKKMGAVWK